MRVDIDWTTLEPLEARANLWVSIASVRVVLKPWGLGASESPRSLVEMPTRPGLPGVRGAGGRVERDMHLICNCSGLCSFPVQCLCLIPP